MRSQRRYHSMQLKVPFFTLFPTDLYLVKMNFSGCLKHEICPNFRKAFLRKSNTEREKSLFCATLGRDTIPFTTWKYFTACFHHNCERFQFRITLSYSRESKEQFLLISIKDKHLLVTLSFLIIYHASMIVQYSFNGTRKRGIMACGRSTLRLWKSEKHYFIMLCGILPSL